MTNIFFSLLQLFVCVVCIGLFFAYSVPFDSLRRFKFSGTVSDLSNFPSSPNLD